MPLSVDIEKRIGRFHLQSRFEVEDETLAILGASGCGKSMTLKCIAGVETPDRGRIVLDGRTLFDSEKRINLPARKRGTGYLFQNYALFPNMTVERNIACAVHLRDKRRVREIVREKIGAFYLTGLEKRYPAQLSGGQQQRVALARILAGEPKLLMLDEPFSALDSYLKWQLEQEVMRLIDQFRGPVLFVSHNRDEVYRLCSRIVVMENGLTQDAEQKADLFLNPKTLSAALLSGCKNISAAEKTGPRTVFAKDWNAKLDVGRPVPEGIRYVGFRAHYFEPVEAAGANTVDCEVVRVIDNLFSDIVLLRAGGADAGNERSQLRYELPREEWEKLSRNGHLILHLPPDKLLLLR